MERKYHEGHKRNGITDDDHHVIFNRIEWEARQEARKIRETQSLVVHMPRIGHNWIHTQAPPVPLLGVYALQRVDRIFKPSGELFADISKLQSCIEQAGKHPKAHRIERDLGLLAIDALDVQIPLLKQVLKN